MALPLLLGLVVSFGLLEMLTRLIFPPAVPQFIPSQHFRLIYELNPRSPEINSLGMRDEELDLVRLHEHFVIAVIGDSHTYSVLSPKRENSFPARLQHHLNAIAGRQVKVLNFGVPGYNTIQELEVLRTKVLRLKPDLVVLQYTVNDAHIPNYIQPKHVWFNQVVYRSVFLTTFWTRLLYSGPGQRHVVPYVEKYAPDLLLFDPGLVGTERSRDTDPIHMWPHPPRSQDQVPARYHDFIGTDNMRKAVRAFGQICREARIPAIATGFIEDHDEDFYRESGFLVHSFFKIFDGIDMHAYGYDPACTWTHFDDNGSDWIGKALSGFIQANISLSTGAVRTPADGIRLRSMAADTNP
ncbi:MAG: SGNH/GDSL hydrolase family protein [Kiritimatiellia bacterium]